MTHVSARFGKNREEAFCTDRRVRFDVMGNSQDVWITADGCGGMKLDASQRWLVDIQTPYGRGRLDWTPCLPPEQENQKCPA